MKPFLIATCILMAALEVHAQPDNNAGVADVKAPVAVRGENAGLPVDSEIITINRSNNPENKLDTSTPEATVRSFVWALNLGDVKSLSACVSEGWPVENLTKLSEYLKGYFSNYNYLISDLHSYSGDEYALVTLRLTNVRNLQKDADPPTCERLRLHKENGQWRITVPEVAAEADAKDIAQWEDLLVRYAAMVKGAQVELIIGPGNREVMCQHNMKQIGLGILQYVQDKNQKFAFTDKWQNELEPYLRNKSILHCPGVKMDRPTYSFNQELPGKTLDEAGPASCVILVYEGHEKKFEYRHMNDTLTNILFVDGHVATYTAEQLQRAMLDGQVVWGGKLIQR